VRFPAESGIKALFCAMSFQQLLDKDSRFERLMQAFKAKTRKGARPAKFREIK
jgi:hypothetical protein